MDKYEKAATILENTGRYRIFRQIPPVSFRAMVPDEPTLIGMILDLETTGLDPKCDEVIELGAIKFEFGASGRIYRILDTFSQLHQPTRSIPSEIAQLTGITDCDVAGHRIDGVAVRAFASDVELVIAHNARFDRPFCERYWPVFQDRAWACSCYQVPWQIEGHRGTKLEYLLCDHGYFHRGHRALDDCHALITLLAQPLPASGQPALATLVNAARKPTMRLWAQGSPIAMNEKLKARRYRWNGTRRSWYIDLNPDQVELERIFLKEHVFGRPSMDLPIDRFTARVRFSARANPDG